MIATTSSQMLEKALKYLLEYKFSIIPIKPIDKTPLIGWIGYQKMRPTEHEVRAWFRQWPDANIAIVTGSISGICVIDVDEPAGEDEIRKLANVDVAPCVVTPRGGHHYYMLLPSSKISNNAKAIKGCDFRGEGGYVVAPPSRNPNGGYSWVRTLDDSSMHTLPQKYIDAVAATTQQAADATPDKMFTAGRRDNDMFHIANSLVRGGLELQEIMHVMGILGKSCDPPFPTNEMRIKVESALKRHQATSQTSLATDVRGWISSADGTFCTRDLFSALNIVDRGQKQYAGEVLRRMLKQGVIVKHGKKAGEYRKLDEDLEEIDWRNAQYEPLDLWLPLGLHEISYIFGRNIIVIAGSPNSGKTAMLLNILKNNQNKFKTTYFSSEMYDVEFAARLRRFEDMRKRDWNFRAVLRSNDFADVIDPEGLNIIDYMEVLDEFWKVGQQLKDIHGKLKGGVAVIALQKAYGKAMGAGGSFGSQKPRLYLSVDKGQCTIIKGKNPIHDDRPLDYLTCRFKVERGTDITQTSPWGNPNEEDA